MNFYKALLLLTCLFPTAIANAQLSTYEQPFSFSLKGQMSEISRGACQKVTTPSLDMAKIEAEDKEDEINDVPPRFGYPHIVSYDLNNSGTWYKLPNGDKLWQLNVVCPDALSVNFTFDKFWIPEGGKFFVYSKDRKHHIGAFTSRNNDGSRENLGGFSTELIYGSDVILEYYQPKGIVSDAVISVDKIVHGYRLFGDAGACMVNINCEEGQNWQYEKKAVARVLLNANRMCTGSLLNTTSLSETPLFLTANHCISGLGDAAGYTTLSGNKNNIFYWNYEAPGCSNISEQPTNYTTRGAIIVANNVVTDFALLQLIEDPKNLPNYTPFYLGWDCTGDSGNAGVCIHHPMFDVKKISTVDGTPQSLYYTPGVVGKSHWRVYWQETANGYGTVEQGSSGAALLNAEHKVIGQEHNSLSDGCNDPLMYTRFGKFSVSWTGNGNDSIQRRLNYWLDPLNTGIQVLEGLLVLRTTKSLTVNEQIYSNIRIVQNGHLTVQGNVELMGNSRVIVESGGTLIIDGGTFLSSMVILDAGASLIITNGGTLETVNGFYAENGSIVNIINGQII